jgi:hypothetical protein
MRRLLLAAVLLAVVPPAARALDVPVAGYRLTLRGRGIPGDVRGRSLKLVVKDPALAAPLPDPRLGARLLVNAGAGPGQCQVHLFLDPLYWRALPSGGYRYAPKGLHGIRRIDLRPGLLRITAHGSAWPCDLSATTQRAPVSVVVRAADVRYCAAFGGTVTRNAQGRFAARSAAAPAACPDADITVADLNILHGIFCPSGTQACRLAERVDLLYQWIAAAGLPGRRHIAGDLGARRE